MNPAGLMIRQKMSKNNNKKTKEGEKGEKGEKNIHKRKRNQQAILIKKRAKLRRKNRNLLHLAKINSRMRRIPLAPLEK